MLSSQELKSSTLQELLKELHGARQESQRIRLGLKTSHLKDSSLAGRWKRYIARILTLLREIELDEQVKKANQI